MSTQIKFIYFDVGNVFFTYDKVFTKVPQDFNLDIDKFNLAYDKYDRPALLGQISTDEIWNRLCLEMNITNGHGYNFVQNWISDYERIEATHNLVITLVGKFKLGILSNQYLDMFPEIISQKFLPDINYDQLINSADFGLCKPDPRIYELAQTKSGYKGGEILFIDDKPINIDAAEKFGWQTSLFDKDSPEISVHQIQNILTE